MMKRVVINTNVYISGIFWAGPSREVLDLARAGIIEVYTSQEILDELKEKLTKKFNLDPEEADFFVFDMMTFTRQVTIQKKMVVVKEDPEDDKFIECVVECEADYLVSGDKHLLDLKTYGKTKIMKPKDFLDEVKQANIK